MVCCSERKWHAPELRSRGGGAGDVGDLDVLIRKDHLNNSGRKGGVEAAALRSLGKWHVRCANKGR